jgi:hypothetical protein
MGVDETRLQSRAGRGEGRETRLPPSFVSSVLVYYDGVAGAR